MAEVKKPYKKTREKLENTPFSTVKDMEMAEQAIRLENWRRLATYRDFKVQLEDESNHELKSDLETGVMCGYKGGDENVCGDSSMLRVYKATHGIQVVINETKPADPSFLSSLAPGMVHAFGSLFYEMAGLKKVPSPSNLIEKGKGE